MLCAGTHANWQHWQPYQDNKARAYSLSSALCRLSDDLDPTSSHNSSEWELTRYLCLYM